MMSEQSTCHERGGSSISVTISSTFFHSVCHCFDRVHTARDMFVHRNRLASSGVHHSGVRRSSGSGINATYA